MKLSRLIPSLLLAFHVVAATAWSQTWYQTRQSGSWQDTLTWQKSTNSGSTWVQASSSPSGNEYIQILGPHTVTLSSSISLSNAQINGQLVVPVGMSLTGSGGSHPSRFEPSAIIPAPSKVSSGGISLYGILSIQGSFSISGPSLTAFSGCTVRFNGTGSPQTIPPASYWNLQINNSSGAQLSGATQVDGTLTVSSGNLQTGASTLELGAYAAVSESDQSVVLGMLYSSRACTLGVNQSFGGMGLEITRSGGPFAVTFSVTRYTGSAPSVTNAHAIARTFDISPTINTGHNASLVFHYFHNELNGADENALVLYKSSGGGVWTNVGGSVNISSNSISVGGIDSFSLWTAAAPIPIPTITSISPILGTRGSVMSLTILGTNFATGGTSVGFGSSGITVNSVSVSSHTQLTATIAVSTLAPTGFRDVMVTTSYGTGIYSNGFQIENPAPTITGVSPPNGALGVSLALTIQGSMFISNVTTVSLGAGITVNSISVTNSQELVASIAIAPGATLGPRSVVVTNPSPGGGTATLSSGFSVLPVPTFTGISPAIGARGQTLSILFTGSNFSSGATTIDMGPDITLDSVTVLSATQIRALASISYAASTGARDVSVSNSGGLSGAVTLSGGFSVINPAPTITSVVPGVGARGKLVNVTINGTGFIPSVTTALPVSGLTLVSATFVGTTQITGSFLVARDAALGFRDMTIANTAPGGGSATLANAFEVRNPSPTATSVTPVIGTVGQTLSVVVTGMDFISGVTSVDFGSGITAGPVTIDSVGTHVTASITIAPGATAGSRNVTVTNVGPGGGSSALASAFTVANLLPTLTSLSTYAAGRGQTLDVTMTGTNFQTGVTTASFGVNITVNSLKVSSPTSAIANITVAASAIIGARSVSVTNPPPGGGTSTIMSVFNVGNPTPTLSSIVPASGARGQTLDAVLTGTGFVSGISALTLGPDIAVNSLTVTSFTQINANIFIALAGASGSRDVTVSNGPPGGGSGSLLAGFTVNNPLPTIASLAPSNANRGSIVNITVLGSQFIAGVTSLSFGTDIVVNSIVVKSPTEILANITLSSLAASGSRTVTVTNASPAGGSANLPLGFTVGTGTATSVEGDMGLVPDQFALQEAYPNPFNPSTRIRYGVPEDSRVRIVIHNMLGNIVAELVNGQRSKGTYEMQWHADYLPSGVYLIRMNAESTESTKRYISSRKVILMK
jgi:hypothetical protein